MGFFVYSAELFEGCMSIHLRCRRACVTQQSPDTFYTCAIIEHCGCERVSQHVWREFFLCADKRKLHLHPMPHVNGFHSITFQRDKQRVTLANHLAIPTSHVATQCYGEFFSVWHHPLLVTFSGHFQLAVIAINVHIVKTRQLGQAYARLVEGHDYRPIPDIQEACAPWQIVKQTIHLAFLDKRRQSLAAFRRLYPIGGVTFHKMPRQGITKKRSKSGEPRPNARCFHTTIHEMFHPITDYIFIDCLPAKPIVKTMEEFLKFPKRTRVRLYRSR